MEQADKLEAVEKKLDRVLAYLHNDPETGQKGLVASFKEHQEQFSDHERKFSEFVTAYEKEQAVKKAKMGVWGAIGGAILTFLVFIGKAIGGWFLENFHK